MRIITKYECEVCRNKYDTEEAARTCESRGATDTSKMVPGVMFQDKFYGPKLCFTFSDKAKDQIPDGHYVKEYHWATRDNGMGDSLDNVTCGGGGYWSNESIEKDLKQGLLDPTEPCVKRMAKYLRSKGYTPIYWDGKSSFTQYTLDK